MNRRKDKFRPSVINPAEFVFVAHHYLGHSDAAWEALCQEMNEGAELLEAHQDAHPGFTVAGHGYTGRCDCCGAHYLYGATFHTATSNTYISVGGTCAGKLQLGNPAAMKTFREQVNTWKIHADRVVVARQFVTKHHLGAALDKYLSNAPVDSKLSTYDRFPHVTLLDIMGKLVQWGTISEKQKDFAVKLLAQIEDQPRQQAEREAKDAARQAIPAFIKRATVEGIITSAKVVEGDYGTAIKIVVEHADGWKVWGTACTDLTEAVSEFSDKSWLPLPERAELLKGKRVRFDCKIVVSERDSKFGFFKRPTKAALLDSVPHALTEVTL